MDLTLRNQVVRSQRRLLNLIQSHQKCYERISFGEESPELTEELKQIRADIVACNVEQSELLKQVSMSGSVLRCNLYQMSDLPPGSLPTKNRRKNAVTLTPAQEAAAAITIVKAPSPSPPAVESPPESESDLSDLEDDSKCYAVRQLIKEMIPNCCPDPVPLEKASIIPRSSGTTTVQLPQIRRQTSRLSRRQQEQLAAELPVYPPSVPTPPPKDEQEEKHRFMMSVKLMPRAEGDELRRLIQARRSERKRRSAVNSPYSSSDWEMSVPIPGPAFGPMTRRQCLAAVRKEKQKPESKAEKKGKSAEAATEAKVGCTKCGSEIKKSASKSRGEKNLCHDCCETHDRTDTINNNLQERGKYKMQLIQRLRGQTIQLGELKKSVIPLLESKALQERLQKDQIREQQELSNKIDTLRNFVTLYQRQTEKISPPSSPVQLPPDCDKSAEDGLPDSINSDVAMSPSFPQEDEEITKSQLATLPSS